MPRIIPARVLEVPGHRPTFRQPVTSVHTGHEENTMNMNRISAWIATLTLALGLGGCGYNDFQRLDEQVKGGWAEVLNQYQRRADLIPNIVATVKGEANFEQETLTKVIEARSKATSIQATPELVNNPAAFKKARELRAALPTKKFAARDIDAMKRAGRP
ncbi:hypothetical protein B566_EDAN018677 [Ephemera danica]|nr:hypothetical protein B566_EDAN018677 [Ephemera danica]